VDLSEISCDDVLHEIEHYLHGELDSEHSAELARHLSDCYPCLERAEFQRKLKEIVRSKCQSSQAPPADLVVRVRRVIHAEFHSGRDAEQR
jgi:anti-sigma factor (TIGR02949 family)